MASIDPPRASSSDAVSARAELALIAQRNASTAMGITPRGRVELSETGEEGMGGEFIPPSFPTVFTENRGMTGG
ncbi:hypothetical protein GCM10022630_28030 [Thermobifida alba]